MGSDTILCGTVHLISTDLDLKRLSLRTNQRSMQRLVHIGFGHGNIIFETSRNRLIHLMDHTQCRITVFDRFHQNTYSKQIIDLIQCLILVDHLFINAEEMLHSSLYICLDLGIVHVLFDFRHDGLYIFLTGTLLLCDLGYQIIIDIRLQIFQRQIIQLDLYFRNTKTL